MAKVQHITNVARRKKTRRRVHRGRVTMALVIVALIVVGLALAFSTDECESPITHRHVNAEAVAAAQRDAAAANALPAGSMERQQQLLSIKAKESELRQQGFNHAADDYISTVNSLIK